MDNAKMMNMNTLQYISFILICSVLFGYGCKTKGHPEDPNAIEPKTGQNQDQPELLSIDQFNTQVAYVPSIGEGTISAIDLENNSVKWTIKVSEGRKDRKAESSMGIASTLDGRLVFTGDVATKEVVVVDADKQKVIKRISLQHGVHAVDISPHGHWVWVAGTLENYPWLTATTIIDVEKLEKVTTLSPALGGAAHFAWTPDAKEVWAASISTNTVWVWDAVDKKVLDVIPLVGENLQASSPEAALGLIGFNEIAITPDGHKAFALGPEAGIVFEIDVKERQPIKSLKVGERTHGVGVTRDGKEVWTANNTGTVTILDVESLEILDQIDLSKYTDELPYAHIAFSLDGQKAYVSIAKDIAVIDVGKREVLATIPFGYGTHEISLEDFYVKFDGEIQRQKASKAESAVQENSQEYITQTSREAGITVAITPKRSGEFLLFDMQLDTHSGDLMVYDLANQTILYVNNKKMISEFEWDGESESSHHRSGTLKIKVPSEGLQFFELEVKDIGVPSRKFQWNTSI